MDAAVLATEPLAYSHPSFAAVLTVLVLAPAAGALMLLVLPRSRPDLFKLVALLASLVPAALVAWMLGAFETDIAHAFQFWDQYPWIKGLGVSWQVGVDGLSLFLVVMTALIFPLAIVGVDAEHSPKPYYA